MRVLAIYRHYWPDATPYARILRTILEHLASAGHDVDVLTAQPGYHGIRQPEHPTRETLNRVGVRRVRLYPARALGPFTRMCGWLYFLVRAVVYVLVAPRYDVIIANSHPPVLMGCALRLIRRLRRTPYMFHCQDIHPESAALAGDLRTGWLYRLLLRWDTETCREAKRVVVLSHDMRDSLLRRGLPATNVSVINNPPLDCASEVRPMLPAPLDEPTDDVRFLFAGNLGRFQGLERLIAAAHQLPRNLGWQLIFLGEGDVKRRLVASSGALLGDRIFFLRRQPVETAAAAMRVCDYGVVSLLAGVYRFAYPSKSMMYLSAGCPLLVLIEGESEIACTVQERSLGYVSGSRSVADIAEVMRHAITERPRWTPARRESVAFACHELFGRQQMLAAWDELFEADPRTLRTAA